MSGTTGDFALQVVDACGTSPTVLVCSDPEVATVTGLIPTNTYYVRVASWTSTTGQNSNFTICITTPPPPPVNDACANAIIVSVNATCGTPESANTAAATMDTPSPGYSCWSSSNDDDIWYTFTTPAIGGDITITVSNYNSPTTSLGYGLFTGACGSTVEVSPTTACDITISNTVNGTGSLTIAGLAANTTYMLSFLTSGTGISAAFDFCLTYILCPVPTALSTSNITSTTADISWNGSPGGTFILEYGPAGFTPGTGTTAGTNGIIITPATSPQTLIGLTPSTNYDVYVRQDCSGAGNGYSANSALLSFTSGAVCTAPTGLSSSNITANSVDINWTTTGGTEILEYGPAGFTPGTGATAGTNGTVISPASAPQTIAGLAPSTNYNVYIRQDCTAGSNGYSVNSTMLSFTTAVACAAPTAISKSNITANSVDISWTTTGGTEILEYGPTGYTPGTGASAGTGGTLLGSVTSPVTINGLNAASGYDVFIRQDCSAGSNGYSFNLSTNVATTGAPVNDTICGAIDLMLNNTIVSYVNTTNATVSATDPSITCTTPNNNVWFKFTTSTAGIYNINAFSSQIAPYNTSQGNKAAWMWLYSSTGTCPAVSLTQIADLTQCTATGYAPAAYPVPANVSKTFLTPSLAAGSTYYFIVDGADGSFGNIGFTVSSPLSIKLDKLTAINIGNANRIDWNTTGEERNDRFELERSIDGKSFTKIYEKRANGEPSMYSYIDNDPAKGYNYYRLNMIDANGDATYSNVVTAFVKSNGFAVEAFPNPVSHNLTVRVSGLQGSDATIQVTDVTGKTIRTITMNASQETINMSSLANGIYLIKYSDTNHTQTIRVSKQ